MKTALVTGASKGIGAAIARQLKKDGYHVYLHGRNQTELSALEKELGQSQSTFRADLIDPSQVEKLAQEIKDKLKTESRQLDLLVNNAGIYQIATASEARQEFWVSQMQVNLLAPVRLTELLLPQIPQSKGASIINISSGLGLRAKAGTAAYSASKAALIHWTKILALEMGPLGIRVNCVCPGLVDTPIHPFHSLPKDEKNKIKDQMKSYQPLGRIGEPEEIAEAVSFLASEKSKWTTGTILTVDGGINI